MKVGISVTSALPDSDVREGPKQMLARAKAAAGAGLNSLFVGDHHVVKSPYYQNVPMIARMMAEWDQRDIGALFLLPMWHPVLAAEQIATLACLTQGKFIMQCGLGHGEAAFKAMGTEQKYRVRAFEQSIEVMRALWCGDKVSLDGHWKIEDAQISPQPPQDIEIWIGASADVAIERAARMGDVWLASPGIDIAAAKRQLEVYLSALSADQKAVPDTIAIRRDVYVAESPAEANEVRSMVESRGYRGFDSESLVIGDANEVAEQFLKFNAIGFTDVIVRNLHRDYDLAIASTERLATVTKLLS
jgi:alkanesulfonate monooxygenase SsuD/methylene tetrahydromethanopterin reductase-like flavin-dependent oxidoreductase (luciferase family)